MAGDASRASSSHSGAFACPWPNTASRRSTSTGEVVSSSAMPIECASIRRRFMTARLLRPRKGCLDPLLVGKNAHRVEKTVVRDAQTELAKAERERRREPVDARRDPADPQRAVVHGVHARDDGEERLRGAHVARRLFATNVLLARLKSHAQRGLAVRVDRDADDAPRELAHQGRFAREERGMRAAVAQRYAEALSAPVPTAFSSSELSRGDEERQCQKIARHGDGRAGGVSSGDEAPPIVNAAVARRILQEDTEHAGRLRGEVERSGVAHEDVDPVRNGAGPEHVDRLRMAVVGHEDRAAPVACGGRRRLHHVHRLRGGGGFVEKRRVRDLERRQVADHRLEVEQRFEPALRDLRLVRRVLRVPAGVLEHVALDDGRRDALRVPHSEETLPELVLCRRSHERDRARRARSRPPADRAPGENESSSGWFDR